MALLNDEIIAYLAVNSIEFSAGDYQTGQPQGQADQVLIWNEAKLGAQPTQAQLDAAYATYQGQQIAKQNKAQASSLLSATDWTVNADVTTGTHKLTNQAEFIAYRNTVRAIAVNPPTTIATFPAVPKDIWGE
jgi:hypothetical protein